MKRIIFILLLSYIFAFNNALSQTLKTKQIQADSVILSRLGIAISNGKAVYYQSRIGEDGKAKIMKTIVARETINIKKANIKADSILSPRVVVCSNSSGAWTYFQKIDDYENKTQMQELLNNLICVSFKFNDKEGECNVEFWYEALPDFSNKLNDSINADIANSNNSDNQTESYFAKKTGDFFQNLLVFPNPISNSDANIEFSASNSGSAKIIAYNINGEIVKVISENYSFSSGENKISFNLSGLSSGMYIIAIEDGEHRGMARILKN